MNEALHALEEPYTYVVVVLAVLVDVRSVDVSQDATTGANGSRQENKNTQKHIRFNTAFLQQ